ncbi:MAG TPA: acyl-homoserine-lactone synthase [Clostridium sp.]
MYTYRIAEVAEEIKLIYKLRYDIYCKEKGWLSSSSYLKHLESDKYDKSSLQFGAFDVNNILVGSVRLIIPGNNMQIPIEESFEIVPNLDQKRVEVSRLVIPKDRRGYNISMGLIRTIYEWAIKDGMTHAYAIIENDFMIYINRKGYPFKPIKEGKDYFGGYTIPTCLILSDVDDYFIKNKMTVR